MRSTPRCMAVFVAAAALATLAFSSPALALTGGSSTVCEGAVTVSYSPGLTAVPAPGAVAVTLNSATLPCIGPATQSVTVAAAGSDPIGASCAGPLAAVGSGSLSTTTLSPTTVEWIALGTPVAQSWAFSDAVNTPPLVEAWGAAAWTMDGAGITSCSTTQAITAVTLTAVLVIVA